jgi:hypothetical protein
VAKKESIQTCERDSWLMNETKEKEGKKKTKNK